MEIDIQSLRTREDWLNFFAQLGAEAQKALYSVNVTQSATTWESLGPRFFAEAYPPIPSASQRDYERWLANLVRWAETQKIASPDDWGREQSAMLACALRSRGTDPARRFRFYRRVWQTMRLDSSIWNVQEALPRNGLNEHYRRLTTGEVRKLVARARKRSDALADMLLIGYWTGLRLSDVAELEKSEVSLLHKALHLVPNKVKTRKPQPLTIPLVGDAEAIIRMRVRQATGKQLFPMDCRTHLSRRFARIFKAAHVSKIGNGRASFHSLRATFISLMDEAGVQPYITDSITGHASGNMHARYTQPSLPILRRAIARAIPKVSSDAVSVYLDSESKTRLTSPHANRPFAGSVGRKNRKNKQMKKLMIGAAAAAMIGSAQAWTKATYQFQANLQTTAGAVISGITTPVQYKLGMDTEIWAAGTKFWYQDTARLQALVDGFGTSTFSWKETVKDNYKNLKWGTHSLDGMTIVPKLENVSADGSLEADEINLLEYLDGLYNNPSADQWCCVINAYVYSGGCYRTQGARYILQEVTLNWGDCCVPSGNNAFMTADGTLPVIAWARPTTGVAGGVLLNRFGHIVSDGASLVELYANVNNTFAQAQGADPLAFVGQLAGQGYAQKIDGAWAPVAISGTIVGSTAPSKCYYCCSAPTDSKAFICLGALADNRATAELTAAYGTFSLVCTKVE